MLKNSNPLQVVLASSEAAVETHESADTLNHVSQLLVVELLSVVVVSFRFLRVSLELVAGLLLKAVDNEQLLAPQVDLDSLSHLSQLLHSSTLVDLLQLVERVVDVVPGGTLVQLMETVDIF